MSITTKDQPIEDSPSKEQTLLINITEDIERKKRERERLKQGILYHAALENKKSHVHSLQYLLEKKAEKYFHEFEVWQNKKDPFVTTTRNILDFLGIYHLNSFKEILKSEVYLAIKKDDGNTIDDIQNFSEETKVFLIVDYKTGEKNVKNEQQVENYITLISALADTGWFKNTNNSVFLGMIYYKKMETGKEFIHFVRIKNDNNA